MDPAALIARLSALSGSSPEVDGLVETERKDA